MWKPTQNGSELYHYGVIGMKWGVHKAYHHNHKMRLRQSRQYRILQKSKLGQKDPRFLKLEEKNHAEAEKRSAAIKSVVDKSSQHLKKLDEKYQKAQNKADAKYQKAERKANSLFATKRSADRAFRKAAKYQFKANKIAYKGKKFYETMINEMGISPREYSPRRSMFYGQVDKETRALGRKFVDRVERSSKAMYAVSYVGG